MLFDSLGDVGVWALWLRERVAVAVLRQFCPTVKSERHDRRERIDFHTFRANGILEASASVIEISGTF